MRQSPLHVDPLVVLVDRSRDGAAGTGLLCLRPGRVFHVEECRSRLRPAILHRCDVLAVCGHSLDPHTQQEAMAIRQFVRRGGLLVLAANAGRFEQTTGRSARDLGNNALARLFGFEILTASGLETNIQGQRGYSRDELRLTASGCRLGCALGQIRLERAGPIAIPPGAQVLLRHRSGRPVAATAAAGRGRVLVCGELSPWLDDYNPWVAAHWLAALAGSSRRRGPALPRLSRPVSSSLRRGNITVSFQPRHRPHARRVLDHAGLVWAEWSRWLRPARGLQGWRITLQPGAGYQLPPEWWIGPTDTLESCVGEQWNEGFLVAHLTEQLGERWVLERPAWVSPQFRRGMIYVAGLHVLENLGFADLAVSRREVSAKTEPGDLGRSYPWNPDPAVERRFWLDLTQAFGVRALRKLLAVGGAKDPYKDIRLPVYTDFDRLAYLLGCALGPRVYPWLRDQGHTVLAMALHKPGSAEHRRSVQQALERMLGNPGETASQRFEALHILASRLAQDKVPMDLCARRVRSPRLPTALPAAARLALAHDARGVAALRSLVPDRDDTLTAAVTLVLAEVSHEVSALDWLARRAKEFDLRYQLSAGHVLNEADDPRGTLYSFSRLPGCRVRVVEDGFRRVFLNVDGRDVANVWCSTQICVMPGENAVTTFYVEWVFTLSEWRRRGLARLGLVAGLDSDWEPACATTSLHTGARNVAHTLYREWGLQDCGMGQSLRKVLRREPILRPPRGIRIRPGGPRDGSALQEFVRATLADRAIWPGLLRSWSAERARRPVCLAFAGRTLVGAVAGRVSRTRAEVEFLAIAPFPGKDGAPDRSRREQVGAALLSRLHRTLLGPGRSEVTLGEVPRRSTESDLWVCQRMGYGRERSGLVELHRINDLARFLADMAPLLEQRLREKPVWRDWVGTVVLEGGALRARLAVDHARVRVHRLRAPGLGSPRAAGRPQREPDPGEIIVRGDPEAIQGIALGLTTPFEGHLQTRVRIIPSWSPAACDLLEILFPRVIVNT